MLLEIISSAVNPLFFRQAVRRSAGRAFVYYLLFTTLHTILICALGFWWASGHWDAAIEKIRAAAPAYEVTLDQGHLSTTFPEPYVFSTPELTVILDTQNPVGIESVPAIPRALILSRTKMIVKKNDFQFSEYSWSSLPDFQVRTDDLVDGLKSRKQIILWGAFLTLALGILPLVWIFFIPVALIFALPLWIVAKALQRNLSYPQTLTIVFYALTLPVLAQTALLFFAPAWAKPSLFWAIYLVWALVGVWTAGGSEENFPQGSTTP